MNSRVLIPLSLSVLALFAATAPHARAKGGAYPEWHAPADLHCREQAPQDFLIRRNMFRRNSHGEPTLSTAESRRFFDEKLRPSILWRTRTYGYASDPVGKQYAVVVRGAEKMKPLCDQRPLHAATDSIALSSFMGLEVQMHTKVLPALKCVENDIQEKCMVEAPMCGHYDQKGICKKAYTEIYHPKVSYTMRTYNSYGGGEITNHLFGLAIDLDPDRNPCCGCKGPSLENPRCKWKTADAARADVPKCWVDSFRKYGFYWLGEDDMGDTMHFEFLGDPDKVVLGPNNSTAGTNVSGICRATAQPEIIHIDQKLLSPLK